MAMKLLEYLDKIGERRHQRKMASPHRPLDVKSFIGLLFLLGYYVMVWNFSQQSLPEGNLDLIRDAMLTLGPPVGAIVAALFRSDIKDEQQVRNSGEAFRAIGKVAENSSSGTGDPKALNGGDEVILEKVP